MQQYEILYILKPNQTEEEYNQATERLEGWITKTKGNVLVKESWGARDLAYEIKKQTRGFYALMQFEGSKETLDELEKRIKLDKLFLRHLIVKAESVKPITTAEK